MRKGVICYGFTSYIIDEIIPIMFEIEQIIYDFWVEYELRVKIIVGILELVSLSVFQAAAKKRVDDKVIF